jgi:hypothetical protein
MINVRTEIGRKSYGVKREIEGRNDDRRNLRGEEYNETGLARQLCLGGRLMDCHMSQ